MRRSYEHRLEVMVECLHGWSGPAKFKVPDGGMSLWGDMGTETAALAEKALALGVGVTPGRHYGWQGKPSKHLRLGFAHPTPEEIRSGLALLERARG